MRGRSRWAFALTAWVCLAPAPGDIGGCGQPARDLDAEAFFASKQEIECSRCQECGLRTAACQLACDRGPTATEFPVGCFPLVHDGIVCLRALGRASCEEHRQVVADAPRVPSECNFCPAVPSP